MAYRHSVLIAVLGFLCAFAVAYEVPVEDAEYSRQICSGMWANQYTHINVSFDPTSQGHLAMVIYEWRDVAYLGKVTSETDEGLPKTYVCTSNAVTGGFCTKDDLGKFILDLPSGKTIGDTSFWLARVAFNGSAGSMSSRDSYGMIGARQSKDSLNPSPSGILQYSSPINYKVRKTGYYCVAIVPVTVLSSRRAPTDVPFHPKYHGTVLFKNAFNGMLPATDYPKVNFYFTMCLAYAAIGGAWLWLCWTHRDDLQPIQYYLSSLFGLLVIEMLANWAYYRYLNAHGKGMTSTVFLFVVAILDAGRNALSYFLLLIVSLGLSVVRESLGKKMFKCQALAVAHFVFGVLYAVGIVELELESTSALLLLLFVIPLAFTLSGFMMWILYALNGTIAQLQARKQRYKLTMFRRLYKILLGSVLVIAIFFVVSSMTFTGRMAEDYSAKTWKVRWWLLDGWLALLYFVSFSAIAYLWRPSAHNIRYVPSVSFSCKDLIPAPISTLAMSDELAQDEEDAEDYDLEALESRTRAIGGRDGDDDDDDDDATLVGRRGGMDGRSINEDQVVFEIGDEDEEDDDQSTPKRRKDKRKSGERERLRLSEESLGGDGTG